MKNRLSIIIVIIVLLCGIPVFAESSNVSISISGKYIEFKDQKPFVDENNQIMVPLKQLFESYGASVLWNNNVRAVEIRYFSHDILIPVDKDYIIFDDIGTSYAKKIINGTTFINVNVIELFGAKIENENGIVNIVKDAVPITRLPKENRIWIGMENNNIDQSEVEALDKKILSLETQIEALSVKASSNKTETNYLITGDILFESSDYILVNGSASGIGSGYYEGVMAILKPHGGRVSYGDYVGANAYVGEDWSNTYGTIKVYKEGAENVAFSEMWDLDNEKDKLIAKRAAIVDYDWREHPYTKEINSKLSRFYDESNLFTFDYETALFTPTVNTFGYSHSITLDNNDQDNTEYADISYETYYKSEDLEKFLNRDARVNNERNQKYSIKFDELVDSTEGIKEAYLAGTYDSYWCSIYIVLENQAVLIISVNINEPLPLEAIMNKPEVIKCKEFIKTFRFYNAAG